MEIRVAIPVYDGKLPVQTVTSLLNEKTVANGIGDDILVEFLPNCSHPAMGRNQLVHSFMESKSDRLIFLDSDITFEPGALIKLAHHPVDYVGAAYRFKFETENYPVGWIPEHKELWSDKNGLIEVAVVPAGFTSFSKNVFIKLKESFPDRHFTHFGHTMHCYFQTAFDASGLHSEESFFAKDWRSLGQKIYLDPEIELTHWDFAPVPFKGHIGNWLKKTNGLNQGGLNAPTP